MMSTLKMLEMKSNKKLQSLAQINVYGKAWHTPPIKIPGVWESLSTLPIRLLKWLAVGAGKQACQSTNAHIAITTILVVLHQSNRTTVGRLVEYNFWNPARFWVAP
jgi:hypothetical protein